MNSPENNILYQAAATWKYLTEYQYIFTYGFKNRLTTINLMFSPQDFPHLAGFQYLKDVSFPRYNSGKIVDKILSKSIPHQQLIKSSQYEYSVKPRLETLSNLNVILENDFHLYSYHPQKYPFTTTIKADYLISSHFNPISYLFIIQASSDTPSKHMYLCCSAFPQSNRNFEVNQRIRKILRKERLHLSSGISAVLYDKQISASAVSV